VFGIFSLFETLLSAVYTGLAERALELAAAAARKRSVQGEPASQDPHTRWRVADAAIRLDGVRLQLDAVFDKIIAESEARREEKKKTTMGKIGDDDLLSVLLRIKDEGELDFPIGTTNIKAIVTVSGEYVLKYFWMLTD
jgi:alkylation response protein AidB-like acyl-CoA dehydrogenase